MRQSEMRELVGQELDGFDSGTPGSPQRAFRMLYQTRRMNGLGSHPERPGETARDVREWAAEYVRGEIDPAFVPRGKVGA